MLVLLATLQSVNVVQAQLVRCPPTITRTAMGTFQGLAFGEKGQFAILIVTGRNFPIKCIWPPLEVRPPIEPLPVRPIIRPIILPWPPFSPPWIEVQSYQNGAVSTWNIVKQTRNFIVATNGDDTLTILIVNGVWVAAWSEHVSLVRVRG